MREASVPREDVVLVTQGQLEVIGRSCGLNQVEVLLDTYRTWPRRMPGETMTLRIMCGALKLRVNFQRLGCIVPGAGQFASLVRIHIMIMYNDR